MTALTPPRRIHVAVAHRDPYVAAGIASLLRSRVDFVVRTGTTDIDGGDDTIDVFVTDYATGLRKAAPAALLVVTDQRAGWQIRRAVDAGVRGYLLHDCTTARSKSCRTRCSALPKGGATCPVRWPISCWTT